VGAITSGEESARYIRETYGKKGETGRKARFVWLTWDYPAYGNVPNPQDFLDDCGDGVEPTLDVEEAEFVVAHGCGVIRGFSEQETLPLGDFLNDGNLGDGTAIDALLKKCADQGLPLICANPDEVVVVEEGVKYMPGKIAKRYCEILSDHIESKDEDNHNKPPVTIFGKPNVGHFEACLRELELNREPGDNTAVPLRVAHVGDSLHHDIAGANASGIPSIFIVGGIHAEELLTKGGGESKIQEDVSSSSDLPSEARLREFFDREGHTPTHVLPFFRY